MALQKAATLFSGTPPSDLPESFGYSLKRRLLGPPMVNEELRHQRLSNVLALGVLSPDGISSSAYGTEEMLIELLPLFGLAAFAVILPMTGVILFVMALVVLSYREVVTVYTRAGGSYVVARENFGPRIAQVAAVALLIDYVVTVAVQVAGGTAAVVSAIPVLGPYAKEISVGVVLIMCWSNLRGIREAGKAFAAPTYLFTAAAILMIVVGLLREAMGNLHPQDVHNITGQPAVPIGSGAQGVALFAVIFTLMRSFANGGSSLTGIEAVSNAVSAFKPPEGPNARKVLVAEGLILGTLVAGISWLAHVTHAIPRVNGYPTVIAQEANLVFGSGVGHIMFYVMQAVDRADPLYRRQHQLQRVPVPDQLRRRGLVPAPLDDQTRAPPGLLQRDHRAHHPGGRAAGVRRLERQPARAVLRDRCVHRVLDGRVRHGQVPPHAQGAGVAAPAGDQLLRGRAHLDRGGGLRGGEVHRGRLAHSDHFPAHGVRAHPAQPPVPDGGRGTGAHRRAETAGPAELYVPDGAGLRR